MSAAIQGEYQVKPPLPFVPGSELSGVVLEIGAGVKRFRVGDKVSGLHEPEGPASKPPYRKVHAMA